MNPLDNPVVAQPSVFRPTVTVVGNREILPSTTQWVRLFALPTNPIDAMATSLGWLWAAYGTTLLTLISPLAVQVALGFIWLFLLGSLGLLVTKDTTRYPDAVWVSLSVLIGVALCL